MNHDSEIKTSFVRSCDQAIVYTDHQLPILCKEKINPLAPLLPS